MKVAFDETMALGGEGCKGNTEVDIEVSGTALAAKPVLRNGSNP